MNFAFNISVITQAISYYMPNYICTITTYFDPKSNEKIFPRLFLGLIQNSASSFMSVGINGSEPTSGSDGRAGGNFQPL